MAPNIYRDIQTAQTSPHKGRRHHSTLHRLAPEPPGYIETASSFHVFPYKTGDSFRSHL